MKMRFWISSNAGVLDTILREILEMQIRTMTNDDLDFALYLTSQEGWSSTPLDFQELMEFAPDGCFIAEADNEKVGMVCASPYGGFGFISNLIVIKEQRKRQYGTILMKHIIDYLENKRSMTQLLDGVIKAVPLYEKLGFKKRCKSLRLEGTVEPKESTAVRFMRASDLSIIGEFDTKYFGASREKFLYSRFNHFPNLCKVVEIEGDLAGYIMGSKSGDYVRIGPWVMKADSEYAEDLLRDFALESEGKTLKIGVLENNMDALQILSKRDFTEIGYSWRMSRGREGTWTFSNHLHAICCAARG